MEGITRLGRRQGWVEWLDFAARMPNYSVSNQLLLASQRPQASLVMSASQWREVGRYPARGSTALRIWAPRRNPARQAQEPTGDPLPLTTGDGGARDPQARVRFLLVPVFDVSQTDGDPLPQQPSPVQPPEGRAPAGMWDALTEYAEAQGFRVATGETGPADGSTNFATRTITIAARGSELSRTLTLAHEVGHMSLHQDAEHRQPGAEHRGRAEVEAESIAYLVAADYDLARAADWQFDYLAHWAARISPGGDGSEAARTAIRETAGRVMAAARPVLEHLRECGVGHPEVLAGAAAQIPQPPAVAVVAR